MAGEGGICSIDLGSQTSLPAVHADPKRTVPWGQQTYDEMFHGFLFFVDEHENLDVTVDPKTGYVKPPDSAASVGMP